MNTESGGILRNTSHRQVFVTGIVIVSFALSGCLTLNPTVTADTSDSAVFEGFSVSDSVVSNRVDVNTTLTATATTTGDVTKLSVIDENGNAVSTTPLAAGQTNVMVTFPANQNATVVAIDAVNGTTIEKQTVTVSGNKLF